MKKNSTIKSEPAKIDFSYPVNDSGDYRDTWRIFRMMSEFVEGYEFLSSFTKEVTILGSARLKSKDPYCEIARKLARLFAHDGYTIITGGGPGIMRAANQGASEGKGVSVGLNIQMPFEQRINQYVNRSTAFYYFFTRKVMLTSPADAFVIFPGGFGTLDELFEIIDNIELGKMCRVPIILVGKKFWQPVLDFLMKKSSRLGSVEESHVKQISVVDTAEAAYTVIKKQGVETSACELSPMNFNKGTQNVDWRIFRIMAELVEGFEFLTGLVEDVTVLGTRGIKPTDPYYQAAYTLGKKLAEHSFTTVTGGAPGIAEAANKGAIEAGGASYALGMEVNGQARINPYVTKSIVFKFPFTRKVILTAPSKAFVFFPGGFGTLHVLFEVLTLIQTKKMPAIPIILYDSSYWAPLDLFIKQTLATEMKTINPADATLYSLVDDVNTIIEIVKKFRHRNEGMKTLLPMTVNSSH